MIWHAALGLQGGGLGAAEIDTIIECVVEHYEEYVDPPWCFPVELGGDTGHCLARAKQDVLCTKFKLSPYDLYVLADFTQYCI